MARRVTSSSIIGPVIATAVVTLFVGLTTDRFFMVENLRNLALQVSIVSLLGIGSTLVIITGGIDLSPGSSVALLTMMLASMLKFMGAPLVVAMAMTVVIGAGLGLWNGVLTAYLRIPAFITTVASLSIFRGFAFMFNMGSPIFSISDSLTKVFYNTILGIPYVFIYVVIFFALAAFVMNYTEMGRRMYAVGGNANAARLFRREHEGRRDAELRRGRRDGRFRLGPHGRRASTPARRTTGWGWSYPRSLPRSLAGRASRGARGTSSPRFSARSRSPSCRTASTSTQWKHPSRES